MPTKSRKTPAKTKSKTTKRISTSSTSNGVRPSFGIVITLAVALIIAIIVSVVSINQLRRFNNELSSEKLDLFNHLATSYITDMEYTVNDKPTMKQLTGYGTSNEDGVFYMTFDFVPYDIVDNNRVPDGEVRHGIIYFWEDKDNNTYSHAFSYHDDASYHPDGTYVKIEP